jgi:hypothetical protein
MPVRLGVPDGAIEVTFTAVGRVSDIKGGAVEGGGTASAALGAVTRPIAVCFLTSKRPPAVCRAAFRDQNLFALKVLRS